LTNAGEIYVIGSNTYGQLCKKEKTISEISLINFPGENFKRIDMISCGSEHIMAVTKNNEVFSWGRNDSS
jgi:alpha-tubulin suppressor-like RCC1 family protein